MTDDRMVGEVSSIGWDTARVFISSTFHDMQAERDNLLTFVFPELHQRCRDRQVHLVEVDLRWGVSQQDSEDGHTLDICLDEIDACRPLYVGVLGHRHGYTSPKAKLSFTEEEIRHALMDDRLPRSLTREQLRAAGIWPLPANEGRALDRCYRWDASAERLVLRRQLHDADRRAALGALEGLARLCRRHALFLLREEALSRQLATQSEGAYFEQQDSSRARLEALKGWLVRAGANVGTYGSLEQFNHLATVGLWRVLDGIFAGERTGGRRDAWLGEASRPHRQYLAECAAHMVQRAAVRGCLREFMEAPGPGRTLVVTGEAGCGKSTMLAQLAADRLSSEQGWLVLHHFVGVGPRSTSTEEVVRRLAGELRAALGHDPEPPRGLQLAANDLQSQLAAAAAERPVLVVIDALDQLEPGQGGRRLGWLPRDLPRGVRLVVSTRPGSWLDVLRHRHPAPEELVVGPLDAEEVTALVEGHLSRYGKSFPTPEDRHHLQQIPAAKNPLYLKVALEELRRFGHFEQLGARIQALPTTLPLLLTQMLERLERHLPGVEGALVPDALRLLRCSRYGLTAEELQHLLRRHGPQPEGAPADRLPDLHWARLRLALGEFLVERSGVLAFFHRELQVAVDARYLGEPNRRRQVHHALAEYFQRRWPEPYPRALDELLHQRDRAEDWEQLQAACLDLFAHLHDRLRFLGPTAPARLLGDLCELLDRPALPGPLRAAAEEKSKLLRESMAQLTRRARGFHSHCQLVQAALTSDRFPGTRAQAVAWRQGSVQPSPLLLPTTPVEQVRGLPGALTLEGSACKTTALACHPDGRQVLAAHGDGQILLWDRRTGICLQSLVCEEDNDIRSMAVLPGERLLTAGHRLFLWDLISGRRQAVPGTEHPQLSPVLACADGRAFTSDAGLLQLRDAESGEVLHQTELDGNYIAGVYPAPGGRFVVSCNRALFCWEPGGDGVLWRARLGKQGADCGAVTDDGHVATGNWKGSAAARDLGSGQLHQMLVDLDGGGHQRMAALPGGLIVSGMKQGYVGIWEAASGRLRSWFRAFDETNRVTAIAVGATGRRLLVGSVGGKVHEYRVEEMLASGLVLQRRDEHITKGVTFVPPGDVQVVSGGTHTVLDKDKQPVHALFQQEAFSGKRSIYWGDHSEPVGGVVATPDGRRIVSGGEDGRVIVWELAPGSPGDGVSKGLEIATGKVTELALSRRGDRVAAHAGEDLICWDIDTGQERGRAAPGEAEVISLCFVDGDRLAAGCMDGSARIWDVVTGELVLTCEGEDQRRLYSLACAGDGRLYGGHDDAIIVWDAASGDVLQRVPMELGGGASALTLGPGETLLASGHWDETVRVWQRETMTCLAAVKLTARVRCLAMAGHRVAVGSWQHRQVMVLDMVSIPTASPMLVPPRGEAGADRGGWSNRHKDVKNAP